MIRFPPFGIPTLYATDVSLTRANVWAYASEMACAWLNRVSYTSIENDYVQFSMTNQYGPLLEPLDLL